MSFAWKVYSHMIFRWPSISILRYSNVPTAVYVFSITRNMGTYMHPLYGCSIQNAPTRHTVLVRGRICVPGPSWQLRLSQPLYGADPIILAISAEHLTCEFQLIRLLFCEKLHAISYGPVTTDDATAPAVSP